MREDALAVHIDDVFDALAIVGTEGFAVKADHISPIGGEIDVFDAAAGFDFVVKLDRAAIGGSERDDVCHRERRTNVFCCACCVFCLWVLPVGLRSLCRSERRSSPTIAPSQVAAIRKWFPECSGWTRQPSAGRKKCRKA